MLTRPAFLIRIGILAFLGALPACEERTPPPSAVTERCAVLSKRIEALLGPRFKKPVPVHIVDEEFIGKFARESVDRTVPPKTQKLIERLAIRLRQIPPDCRMIETEIRLLRGFAAGLYDPQRHCYYVLKGKGEPGDLRFDGTAAHELAHAYRALEGDYWTRVERAQLVDEDLAIAISCLAEGDAEIIGQTIAVAVATGRSEALVLADVLRSAERAPSNIVAALANPMVRDVPLVLRETLITRYYIGQAFAAAVYRKGGWKALAEAFANPPRSTEQILHPEKYLGPGFDDPTHFEGGNPTAALGKGWRHLMTNTMGEFSVRVHLTEALGRKRATQVAEGWDGVRYHVCETRGAPLFFGLVSTWDSEKDAEEFAAGWKQWAASIDAGAVVVRRRGTRVAVSDGAPVARTEAVLDALLAARARSRSG